jgi:eukaryotic-like serine/threonine-protein kinase
MIAEMSTHRGALATAPRAGHGFADAHRVAEAIKERWQDGGKPDVAVALSEHPELRSCRTVVIDLAYEEYLHHLRAGEKIDAEMFARRFPSFQRSLQLFIAVQGLLSRDSDYRTLQDILPWPKPGSRFLQFDLVSEIGRGSFGRVFLAREPALGGRQVVVKVAPQGGEEAEILARLSHRNIVPVYSLQKDATGLAAFCMPYMGLATLCDVVDYAFLDPHPPERASMILDAVASADDDADSSEPSRPDAILSKGSYVDGVVHLAVQLADALAHSHERGICHRDLKPSNILVTPDGLPLLLDFNLSVDQRVLVAKIGGTVPYMAPEELAVLFQKPHEVGRQHYDPRSDLFSLGVIVYELLTGVRPFGTIPWKLPLDELAFQLHQRQTKGPCPIREHNSQVDARLAGLIESCLAFEPDARPATARELVVALSKELTPVRRSCRWMGNHRKWVGGAVAAMLGMVLIATLFFVLRPSYFDRQLQLGISCNSQGKYAEAVDSLSKAILLAPASAEALLARGIAYQHLGEFQTAFQDYRSAYQHAPSPLAKACEGYCLSRIKSYMAAVTAYRAALEEGYDSPALLYNNVGYSYLMLGQLDDAQECLQRAIKYDGNLQAAHYNLVLVFLRRAQKGRTVPPEALVHARQILAMEGVSGELYAALAILYGIAAEHDQSLVQPAIECVGKAVEQGFSPKTFTAAGYVALQNVPAFHNALQRRVATAQSPKLHRLLDPLAKL